jgi:CheY-like chemotaxis protein
VKSETVWNHDSLQLSTRCCVRALVVDDLEENRTVLAEMLRGIGCEVATAVSGEEALRMITAEHFDVALIDILMPGVDGIETANRLRGTSMKLIAVTASAFIHEQERFRAAGFDDVIVKPVLAQRLCMSLATLPNTEFLPDGRVEQNPGSSPANSSPLAAQIREAIGLPEDLRQRMLSAAEVHGITTLKQCLDQTQQISPAARELCDRLRRSLHNYDMAQFIELLNRQTTALDRSNHGAGNPNGTHQSHDTSTAGMPREELQSAGTHGA